MMVAYWAVLSFFLLVPDPWGILGFDRPLGSKSGVGTHFVAFTILGVLSAGYRLPERAKTRAALLVGYAFATELAQGLVPRRTVQWEDLAENLTGLAAAALILWAVRRAAYRWKPG